MAVLCDSNAHAERAHARLRHGVAAADIAEILAFAAQVATHSAVRA